MSDFDFRQDFEIDEAHLINFLHLDVEQKEIVRNWRNHDKIRKWMYTDHIISKQEHNTFFESLKSNNQSFFWFIKLWDMYIGVIYFPYTDFRNKNTYFGIYANPDCKVPGIGIKLDTLAIKLAFGHAGFHSLHLEVIEDNHSVIDLHERMGFVKEGKLRGFVQKDGIWKDVVVMGMINEGND
jgi:UDP-4-amino-4,6-dideoxy-N-acetyl-beta-L-altrosamine N-acetyltransferase